MRIVITMESNMNVVTRFTIEVTSDAGRPEKKKFKTQKSFTGSKRKAANDQEIEFQEIEIGILQLFAELMRKSKRP